MTLGYEVGVPRIPRLYSSFVLAVRPKTLRSWAAAMEGWSGDAELLVQRYIDMALDF